MAPESKPTDSAGFVPGTGSPAGGRLDRLALRVTKSAQESFHLGRVIGRSFSIWRRDLVLLFVLALVVSSPRILYAVYRTLAPPVTTPMPVPDDLPESFLSWIAPLLLRSTGMALVRSLFVYLSQAVVIFAVYQRLRGRAATLGESFRGGLRRIGPVVRVALVLFVLGTSVSLVFLLAFWFAFTVLDAPRVSLTLVRGLPYVVPLLSFLLLSPFWVAVPAAVVERSRSFLRRSWILTRGRRLQVFLILVIVHAIDWGIGQLYGLVRADLPTPVRMAAWWTQDLLLVALAAVFAVVGYHALRLEKDGVDTSDLADVFA